MAGHGTRSTKNNESQSSCSCSLYNTQYGKKEIISFTVIFPAEFHPLVLKNVLSTLFQGRFS